MKRFWVGFWACDLSKFEYHGPWWVSGERGFDAVPEHSVCAAVLAKDEKAARQVIYDAFDKGHAPGEFRFTSERADDWDPFTDRFRRRDWMKWPWPSELPGDTSKESNG